MGNPEAFLEERAITAGSPGSLLCNKGTCWAEGVGSRPCPGYPVPPCQRPCRRCKLTSPCWTGAQAPQLRCPPRHLWAAPPHHLPPAQEGRARPWAAETTPRAARQLVLPTSPDVGLVPGPGPQWVSVQSGPFRLVPPGERAPGFPEGWPALLGRWAGGGGAPPGHRQGQGRASLGPCPPRPTSGKGRPDSPSSFSLHAGRQPCPPSRLSPVGRRARRHAAGGELVPQAGQERGLRVASGDAQGPWLDAAGGAAGRAKQGPRHSHTTCRS